MHMFGIIAFAQMMIIVRIKLHLKLLIRTHERGYILIGVLHMHIIIGRAVNDEYLARQVFRLIEQRCLIVAPRVHLRPTHIPLRVRAVV